MVQRIFYLNGRDSAIGLIESARAGIVRDYRAVLGCGFDYFDHQPSVVCQTVVVKKRAPQAGGVESGRDGERVLFCEPSMAADVLTAGQQVIKPKPRGKLQPVCPERRSLA